MILILGQARTGTSLAAGVLSNLGFCLGYRFDASDAWNPLGNFVDADLGALNHYLYRGARLIGGTYAPESDSMWVVWRDMIANRQAIKDHALLPLLGHMMRLVEMPKLRVIHTTRPLTESTESLTARREDHNREAATRFQADCETLISGFLETYLPPTLTIRFDDAFRNAEEYVRRVAEFVGAECTKEAVAFITPQLRRF